MFNSMPEPLKKEALYYLQHNDFVKAKLIYDQWCNSQKAVPASAVVAAAAA